MRLTPEKLESHLRGGLAPAYLISGDEPLLAGEAADAIRARARATGFTDREVHFADRGMDWADLRNSAATLSLFASKRIIEIRIPGGKPGVQGGETLTSLIESGSGDWLLLIVAGRLDKDAQSASWVRAMQERGVWLQVWPVDGERLNGWIAERCRKVGLELTGDALTVLVERTEGNLLAAHQEIQKLRLLVDGAHLDAEQVLAAVANSSRFDVFQLGAAALAGDAPRALRILAGLRGEGVEPSLVLWSLLRDLRALWAARHPAAAASRPRWGAQGAALQKALGRAAKFPFARLAARAARADRVIKGRLPGDPWDELALLTTEFCGRRVLPPLALRRA